MWIWAQAQALLCRLTYANDLCYTMSMFTDKQISSIEHAGRKVVTYERPDGTQYTIVTDSGVPENYQRLMEDQS